MADWQIFGCFMLALLAAGIVAMFYDMVSGYRAQKHHKERWVQAPCHRPLAAWMCAHPVSGWIAGHPTIGRRDLPESNAVTVARADGKKLTREDYHWIRERLGMTPDTGDDFEFARKSYPLTTRERRKREG